MDSFFPEGTRVWLKENGQHFPSTVNSCAEGVVVFRTDYGQVGRRSGEGVSECLATCLSLQELCTCHVSSFIIPKVDPT